MSIFKNLKVTNPAEKLPSEITFLRVMTKHCLVSIRLQRVCLNDAIM